MEVQRKIGEINFVASPRPSMSLKCSRNSGLEANLTTLPSSSSIIEMKNDANMVPNKKPSPEEKKLALIQSSA